MQSYAHAMQHSLDVNIGLVVTPVVLLALVYALGDSVHSVLTQQVVVLWKV